MTAEAAREHSLADRTVSIARLLILASLLPLLWLDVIPPEGRMALAGLSILILGYIAGALFVLPRLHLAPRQDLFLTIDILAALALVYFTGGITSTLLPVLYLPLLAAAVRLNLRHTFLSGMAISALVVWMWVMGEGGLPSLGPATTRAGLFAFGSLVIALFFGTLVQEARLSQARRALNALLESRLADATQELRRRLVELESAYDFSRHLAAATTTTAVIDVISDAVSQAVTAPFVAVFLCESTERQLSPARVRGLSAEEAIPVMYVCQDRLEAAGADRPAVVHVHGYEGDLWARGLCAPIVTRDRLIGAVCVGGDATWTHGEGARAVLESIARQGGVALERAYLLEDLQRLALAGSSAALHSRAELDRMVREEIQRATRLEVPFALLRVVIEGGQDPGGAGAGTTELLSKQVAEIILAAVRRVDVVAQDEDGAFYVLMPMTGRDAAAKVGAKLATSIRSDPAIARLTRSGGGIGCRVTTAAFPDDGATLPDLYLATQPSPVSSASLFFPQVRGHDGVDHEQ